MFRGLSTFLTGEHNEILFSNLTNLRTKFDSKLPIEIWYANEPDESFKTKKQNRSSV